MFRFASGKTKELFGGIWGDALITIVAFFAAFLFSRSPLLARLGVRIEENLAVIFYFVIFLSIILFLYFVYNLGVSRFLGTYVPIELTLSTLPGRPEVGFGRYLTMYIDNKSWWDIDQCRVRLRNISTLGQNNWQPQKNAILRNDAFLWGTAMARFSGMERTGSKGIRAGNNHDTLVDLLHTDANDDGQSFYLEQEYLGDTINAPSGIYLLDLQICISHLGQDTIIPFGLRVDFLGGMELGEIMPVLETLDKRIRRVYLSRDNLAVVLWDGTKKA